MSRLGLHNSRIEDFFLTRFLDWKNTMRSWIWKKCSTTSSCLLEDRIVKKVFSLMLGRPSKVSVFFHFSYFSIYT